VISVLMYFLQKNWKPNFPFILGRGYKEIIEQKSLSDNVWYRSPCTKICEVVSMMNHVDEWSKIYPCHYAAISLFSP